MRLPGDRVDVRDRTTTVALHVLDAAAADVRLFVAARPPRRRCATPSPPSAMPPTRRSGARSRREALHVTLAFLGTGPTSDADGRSRRSSQRRGTPRRSSRSARSLLLPPRRARVLTVELDDQTGLTELQPRVSDGARQQPASTPPRRAPSAPHVTVARLRPRARRRATAERRLEPLSFHGTAVTLYASQLHPAAPATRRWQPRRWPSLTATLSVHGQLPRPGGPLLSALLALAALLALPNAAQRRAAAGGRASTSAACSARR